MGLGDIFGNIVDAVTGRNKDDVNQNAADPAFDNNAEQEQDILPASMDPMGDPADDPQYAGNDQLGDGDILPASEDPLGDPADQRQ